MKHEVPLLHFTEVFIAPEGIDALITGLLPGTPLRGERVTWEDDDNGDLVRISIDFVPAAKVGKQ